MLRRAAWAAVLWCAAALYPFVLFMTAVESSNVGFLASAVLTVPTAALMRRHPLPVQAILILAWTVALVEVQNGTVAALQVLVTDLGVCYIAATRPRRVSVPVAVVTLAVQLLSLLAFSPTAAIDLVTATVLLAMAVALMAGTSVRARRAHAEMLREQAREQAAARAVAAERLRISRELHDMIAHSIGVIAIQAGVGGRVIDTQPAEARNALNAIEATSRETLLGLRRMLTALRKGDADAAPLGPAPGLDDLDRLAEAAENAGVKVGIRRRGEPRPVPPDVDLSGYRIVQEAVTNVVRHAGTGECRVTIDYGDGELAIEIEDDGRGRLLGDDFPEDGFSKGALSQGDLSQGDLSQGGLSKSGLARGRGYGLVGMRERAWLLGGDLTAGPRPGGGFRVAARIPLPVAGR